MAAGDQPSHGSKGGNKGTSSSSSSSSKTTTTPSSQDGAARNKGNSEQLSKKRSNDTALGPGQEEQSANNSKRPRPSTPPSDLQSEAKLVVSMIYHDLTHDERVNLVEVSNRLKGLPRSALSLHHFVPRQINYPSILQMVLDRAHPWKEDALVDADFKKQRQACCEIIELIFQVCAGPMTRETTSGATTTISTQSQTQGDSTNPREMLWTIIQNRACYNDESGSCWEATGFHVIMALTPFLPGLAGVVLETFKEEIQFKDFKVEAIKKENGIQVHRTCLWDVIGMCPVSPGPSQFILSKFRDQLALEDFIVEGNDIGAQFCPSDNLQPKLYTSDIWVPLQGANVPESEQQVQRIQVQDISGLWSVIRLFPWCTPFADVLVELLSRIKDANPQKILSELRRNPTTKDGHGGEDCGSCIWWLLEHIDHKNSNLKFWDFVATAPFAKDLLPGDFRPPKRRSLTTVLMCSAVSHTRRWPWFAGHILTEAMTHITLETLRSKPRGEAPITELWILLNLFVSFDPVNVEASLMVPDEYKKRIEEKLIEICSNLTANDLRVRDLQNQNPNHNNNNNNTTTTTTTTTLKPATGQRDALQGTSVLWLILSLDSLVTAPSVMGRILECFKRKELTWNDLHVGPNHPAKKKTCFQLAVEKGSPEFVNFLLLEFHKDITIEDLRSKIQVLSDETTDSSNQTDVSIVIDSETESEDESDSVKRPTQPRKRRQTYSVIQFLCKRVSLLSSTPPNSTPTMPQDDYVNGIRAIFQHGGLRFDYEDFKMPGGGELPDFIQVLQFQYCRFAFNGTSDRITPVQGIAKNELINHIENMETFGPLKGGRLKDLVSRTENANSHGFYHAYHAVKCALRSKLEEKKRWVGDVGPQIYRDDYANFVCAFMHVCLKVPETFEIHKGVILEAIVVGQEALGPHLGLDSNYETNKRILDLLFTAILRSDLTPSARRKACQGFLRNINSPHEEQDESQVIDWLEGKLLALKPIARHLCKTKWCEYLAREGFLKSSKDCQFTQLNNAPKKS